MEIVGSCINNESHSEIISGIDRLGCLHRHLLGHYG